jgi:uncharacterized protein (DUF302 family)
VAITLVGLVCLGWLPAWLSPFCNPPLAHQALQDKPDLGVLLPCNVVVYQRSGVTHISAIDPERMLSTVDNNELAPVAADVKSRLGAVVHRAVAD